MGLTCLAPLVPQWKHVCTNYNKIQGNLFFAAEAASSIRVETVVL